MTPTTLLDEFIRHLRVERGLAENTCLSYGYQLGAYAAFLRGRGRGPAEATWEDVLAYLERRKDDGLKSASLFIAAMAVRQFHRHLAQTGRTSADPTAGMRLPRFKQRIPEPLDAEGMERLLQPPTSTRFAAMRDHSMLELMYASGMRVSELVGLQLGQVNLQENYVKVVGGKGDKDRVIPYGAKAAAALSRYLAVRAARFPAAADTLFLNARGQRLTRSGFGWRLGVAVRRAGLLGRVTPHVVRHSTATAMLEGGASIRVIQEMLGHSNLSTTIQRYAHVSPEFLRRACEKSHPRF